MKIHIVGSGGVGGYFGGQLARVGNDVTFVARGKHLQAIEEHGLEVKSVSGDFRIHPAKVIENVSDITSPDLIIFTVKTYDTQKVASQMASVVTPSTIIITFQNGVDNDIQIKELCSQAQVFPGVAYVISANTAPGVISQTGGMCRLIFGDRQNPDNSELKKVLQLIKDSNIDALLSPDIALDLWKKFVFICAFSGLTAYYICPIGEILSDSDKISHYQSCVREAINVARAEGINLPLDIFDTTMAITQKTSPESKSSLLVDVLNHHPTEIETLNGKLVQLAQKHGISVPINSRIYQKLKSV